MMHLAGMLCLTDVYCTQLLLTYRSGPTLASLAEEQVWIYESTTVLRAQTLVRLSSSRGGSWSGTVCDTSTSMYDNVCILVSQTDI
jgi:hypothetical protein